MGSIQPKSLRKEKEFQKTGQQMDQRANNYQRETGDYEGAERIRELSGWKKYYYEKARAEQAGQGFGAWLNENAGRQVPVNGEMVSLKQANAPARLLLSYLSSKNTCSPSRAITRASLVSTCSLVCRKDKHLVWLLCLLNVRS